MGGLGSGNWYRMGTRLTVEDSLTLAIWDFRERLFPSSSGTFTWSWAGGDKSSIGYFVNCDRTPIITLHYRWRDSEDLRIPVHLQTTPTQFGGRRHWFTCPLIVNGVACYRRVGKLHLPPGERYFGCRTCHGLTYRSCQEAHQMERLVSQIEREGQFVAPEERFL